jgi:hypothetical protein
MMGKPALDHILDGLDIETFLVCQSEEEGRSLAFGLLTELGFKTVDVIYVQFSSGGARIRARALINKPTDAYTWASTESAKRGKST